MGIVRTTIRLSNPRREDRDPIDVDALVDTGALHLCIPEHVALQLGLDELEKREVTVASGARHLAPYVGPIRTTFGNRSCYTGAMVIGTEVLLGAIPVQDMDLAVRPSTREVTVNPANPNVPASIAMATRP